MSAKKSARKLRATKLSQRALATSLGVQQSAVRKWLIGENLPSRETAEKIEKLYGIPAGDWFVAEGAKTAPPQPTVAQPSRSAKPPTVAAATPAPPVADVHALPTLESCIAQLGEVQELLDGQLMPQDRVKYMSERRQLTKLRAHLESLAPVTVDKLARSKPFRDLLDLLVSAIADCEVCRERVLATLEAHDAAG